MAKPERMPCPHCDEPISPRATTCPHCREKLGTAGQFLDPGSNVKSCCQCLFLGLVILGGLYLFGGYQAAQLTEEARKRHEAPPASTAPTTSR